MTKPFTSGFVAAAIVFAAVVPRVIAQQSTTNQERASIQGIVTDSTTGQGLRKAFVRLAGQGASYPAVTDDRGVFKIENIVPGNYALSAESIGYIDAQYGEADGAAIRIDLAAGQKLTSIAFKLIPQAVISGRVTDDSGDVWIHASVGVFRSEFSGGRRKLTGFTSDSPNDQGEFRINRLPPGRYYLRAEPDSRWEAQHRPQRDGESAYLQPTWFPSSLDVSGATPVIVSPGGSVSGLEIRVRLGGTHSVRGTLSGIAELPTVDSNIQLGRRHIRAQRVGPESVNPAFGTIHADGSFEIAGLAAGEHEIGVRQGFPSIQLGAVKVQVADRDLDDIKIQLSPPRRLRGTLRVEEKDALKPSELVIQLDPFISARPTEDGGFEFPQVSLEEHRIYIPGNGFYVKQIRYGDEVSRGSSFTMTAGDGQLEILLSTRGARLSGSVTGSAKDRPKLSGAALQIVLVRNGSDGPGRTGSFDQNGTFSFQDIPPGRYKLYAFESLPSGAWEDPDLLKEIAAKGQDIEFAQGDVRHQDIGLISKADLGPILIKLGIE